MLRTVQWRITVWFVLLVLLIMGALGAYLTGSIRDIQVASLRSRLESAVNRVIAVNR